MCIQLYQLLDCALQESHESVLGKILKLKKSNDGFTGLLPKTYQVVQQM